jgi:uncharacterized protein YdhG (YjbR/CyaY superfamily)
MALGLEGAVEGAHMGHADFRVNGRIFATLRTDLLAGVVKLAPGQQQEYLRSAPRAFAAQNGAWGLQGWTTVHLGEIDEETLGEALTLAWQGAIAKKTPARGKATLAPRKKRPAPRTATSSTSDAKAPGSVDEYIAACAPDVQRILRKVRAIVAEEATGVVEKISYRMPAFMMDGVLIYVAAFKNHIGIYPPVKGDTRLMKALAPHRGEKGNLRFALDEPMPYGLIRRVVQCRVKEQKARTAAKRRTTGRAH